MKKSIKKESMLVIFIISNKFKSILMSLFNTQTPAQKHTQLPGGHGHYCALVRSDGVVVETNGQALKLYERLLKAQRSASSRPSSRPTSRSRSPRAARSPHRKVKAPPLHGFERSRA